MYRTLGMVTRMKRLEAQMRAKLQGGFARLMRRMEDMEQDQQQLSADLTPIQPVIKAAAPGQVQLFLDDTLWWQTWATDLVGDLEGVLAAGSALGVAGARRQMQVEVKWDLLLDGTKTWAMQHAGELVTNLADDLRQKIRVAVTEGLIDGETWKDTAKRIINDTGLSQWRSERIARTETIRAYTQGAVEGYKASGTVRGLRWMSGQAGACQKCSELDGKEIPIGGRFYDDPAFGDGLTPRHPHCRCAIAPVFATEAAR